MSDPQRWRDDEMSSSFERELLGAGALSPPRALEARVWSSLTVQLPALTAGAAAGAGATGSGAGAGASIATATKIKVILSLLSALGIAGAVATTAIGTTSADPVHLAVTPLPRSVEPMALGDRRPQNVPPAAAPATPSPRKEAFARETLAKEASSSKKLQAPGPGRASRPSSNIESVASAEPTEPTRAADASGASPPPSSDLREQALRLREARDALAHDDLSRAESLLAAAARSSSLAEEREALVVQTAMARGDRVRARTLGEAFLVKYPSSPLHERVSKIVARSKSE